ncbi:MAG: DUF4389 domain-containing protein [Pseudomonadota bacterium]
MAERDEKVQGDFENLGMRLVAMIIVWVMMSMAQTLLGLMTVLQFVIMLVNKREPNEQIAEFGHTMGMWMAKAARFQTGASEVKPWPWTMLDK